MVLNPLPQSVVRDQEALTLKQDHVRGPVHKVRPAQETIEQDTDLPVVLARGFGERVRHQARGSFARAAGYEAGFHSLYSVTHGRG